MFVGHAALAFALAALGARAGGWRPERALALGAVAGGFALAPDVDVLYAPVGLAQLGLADLLAPGAVAALDAAFWTAGNEIHRGVTHSAVLAVPVALAAWGLLRWLRARVALAGRGAVPRTRAAPAAGLLALVLAAGLVAGPALDRGLLAGLAMLGAVSAVALVAVGAATLTRLGPGAVGLAALVGWGSHPFGDFLTGSAPALWYPLAPAPISGHLALSPDPTLHLVGAFLVELAAIWLALGTAARLRGVRLRTHLHPRASVGVGYAAAALVIPQPTLEASYHFVLSALAVGFVGATPSVTLGDRGSDRLRRRLAVPALPGAVVTGLAAITLAVVAAGLVYLRV